mmetsp:Transcript_4196/g.9192  ORF Transcript_4196/g.9192 Transcript_4196/m.9192 type:complete len:256 (+) Transcript_4196:306-1073(+)
MNASITRCQHHVTCQLICALLQQARTAVREIHRVRGMKRFPTTPLFLRAPSALRSDRRVAVQVGQVRRVHQLGGHLGVLDDGHHAQRRQSILLPLLDDGREGFGRVLRSQARVVAHERLGLRSGRGVRARALALVACVRRRIPFWLLGFGIGVGRLRDRGALGGAYRARVVLAIPLRQELVSPVFTLADLSSCSRRLLERLLGINAVADDVECLAHLKVVNVRIVVEALREIDQVFRLLVLDDICLLLSHRPCWL